MKSKKIQISLVFVILGILLVLFLWRTPLLLILSLLLTAFIKHKFSPIKKEWQMYVISGILGAGRESLIMLAGSWSYASVRIFNFPIWLPFLWGVAGVTGITLYQGIIEK